MNRPEENAGSAPPHRQASLFPLLLLPVFSSLLLAAHFSRIERDALAVFCLLFPVLLFRKREWIIKVYQLYLLSGAAIWIERALFLRRLRLQEGLPWLRLILILGFVAALTLLSAIILEKKKVKIRYGTGSVVSWKSGFAAFSATAVLLSIVHFKVNQPILLFERFWPGTGMIEVVLLSLYSGWLVELFLTSNRTDKIRTWIWAGFSVVFFSQFLFGLAGVDRMLMTGNVHLPIPALIVAGPIYRGGGLFMPILYLSTLLVAGAAWCSHLCYIGGWDNLASRRRAGSHELPGWWRRARTGVLAGVILTPMIFNLAGATMITAAAAACIYAAAGIGIMFWISRKIGTMAHCTVYCPIGLISDVIGKVNPFRVKISEGCDECGACRRLCRYNALTVDDILKRKPGLSCTLCGDCLPVCPKKALYYKFPGLSSETSRILFLVILVSLHAVFIGVARI